MSRNLVSFVHFLEKCSYIEKSASPHFIKYPFKLVESIRRGVLVPLNKVDSLEFIEYLNGICKQFFANNMLCENLKFEISSILARVGEYTLAKNELVKIDKKYVNIHLLVELGNKIFLNLVGEDKAAAKETLEFSISVNCVSFLNYNNIIRFKQAFPSDTSFDYLTTTLEATAHCTQDRYVIGKYKFPSFKKPKTLNAVNYAISNFIERFELVSESETKDNEIYRLKNVILKHKNNIIGLFNYQGLFIKDLSMPSSILFNHPSFSDEQLEKSFEVESLLVPIDRFSEQNYCHWLLDIFPRILLFSKFNEKKIKILLNQTPPTFVIESLKLIGFTNEDILVSERSALIKAKELYFLSSSWLSHYHPLQYGDSMTLKCALMPYKDMLRNKNDKKIFLSRKKASGRRLINESEIECLLNAHGYKTVYTEDLLFKEQVTLFSQASSVISLHGAGLTNLLFCKSGTKVLEIFHENYGSEAYYILSSVLGLAYTCVNGTSESGGTIQSSFSDNRSDVYLEQSYIIEYLNNAE